MLQVMTIRLASERSKHIGALEKAAIVCHVPKSNNRKGLKAEFVPGPKPNQRAEHDFKTSMGGQRGTAI